MSKVFDDRHRQQHHHINVDLRHIVDLRRIQSSCSFHPMLSMNCSLVYPA
jgi:hypothetical protein